MRGQYLFAEGEVSIGEYLPSRRGEVNIRQYLLSLRRIIVLVFTIISELDYREIGNQHILFPV